MYPFPNFIGAAVVVWNFNGAAVEVWQWVSNFIHAGMLWLELIFVLLKQP